MEENLKRYEAALAKAEGERDALKAARTKIYADAEARGDENLTAEESAEYRAKTEAMKAVEERMDVIREQIKDAKEDIERSQADETARKIQKDTKVEVLSEPATYQRGQRHSYFHDLAQVTFNRADQATKDRMERHRAEAEKNPEMRKLAKVGDEYRNLDRNDGTGGYAVPPLWMMNRFIELARAGRPYANLVPTEGLPAGTDSINIPKINTGTAVDIQTADNATIQEQNLTDTSISAQVKTIAGQQGLAIQLMEQSPIAFDEIVFRDLANDYATKLDVQVISGSGSGNQVTGVRNTAGIQTITATAGADDLANAKVIYQKIADAIQRVHTQRFLEPEVIVMHPRRWAAFLSVFGSDDRPLITTNGAGFNQLAELTAVAAQRVVGGMQGLPVVTDPSLPTTLGTGTNQDVIHVLRASDLLLFESSVRARALQETRAEGLTVLLQIYGFLAFTAARYPKSVVEIGGSALATPTFGG